ncbi:MULTISPECIES: methyltransferase domain-containing protein [Mycetohabitans]
MLMPTDHDRPADQDTDAGAQRTPGLRQLRQIFDRRAAQFCDVAFLPREIAQRMHERLQYIKLQPARVLDAGCGAGEDIDALRARFAQATVYGVDLSRPMLGAAHLSGCGGADAACGQPAPVGGWRRLLPAALRHLVPDRAQPRDRVQADFGALPFAPERFDLLWSNLALQWHARPDLVFPEWQRVLKTGGLLMFSTLGPDTLRELRGAWAVADGGAAQHVLDFVDMHDFGDMLVASGFEIPVMDMETLTITYSSAQSLLADVRRWGAMPPQGARRGDARADVSRGLISRGTYRRLLDALEAQRQPDGTIPLTFEVVYGHAWKAVARVTPEGHGIVRIDEIGHMSRGARRTSS